MSIANAPSPPCAIPAMRNLNVRHSPCAIPDVRHLNVRQQGAGSLE